MCGIGGIVDLGGRPVDPALLAAMNDAIRHRGPDDEGYVLVDTTGPRAFSFSGPDSPPDIAETCPPISSAVPIDGASIGLCHRRFSIIDLSSAGHQPFIDTDRRCAAVFNGEIYNYLELRDELRAAGVRFHSDSDTEVLIEAYKRWGEGCFARLNGFWAIALCDFERARLLVSRDRIGKKPLYWTRCGSRILFASEIKALLSVPEAACRRQVNEAAIEPWLAFGLRDVNLSTFFEGVHSLPQASWTTVDERFPDNARRYWKVPAERLRERDVSVSEAASELRRVLEDAVRVRLRADVPWCVELSGGMDSSALAALAARLSDDRIVTYTVRFGDRECNEEPFARSLASACGADYRVIDSPVEQFWSQILPFTWLHEEPYHSPVLHANQAIYALMRSDGTKVSLNGAGGDELFAGYSSYFYAAQLENLGKGRLARLLDNELNWTETSGRLRPTGVPLVRLVRHIARRKLLGAGGEPHAMDFVRGGVREDRALRTLSETLSSDLEDTKMPYWLRSGDKDYMGVPFEVRAPFLDYRVVELAFRLPSTYHIRHGWHKWILRKALEGVVPDDVLWRRNKMGFPFPNRRFGAQHRALLDTIRKGCRNPYVNGHATAAFEKDWYALSFLLWYELFFNENFDLFDKVADSVRVEHSAADHDYVPEFLCGPCR